jgi:hypothetical protein
MKDWLSLLAGQSLDYWQIPRAASLDGRITLSEAVMGSLDGTLQRRMHKAAADLTLFV